MKSADENGYVSFIFSKVQGHNSREIQLDERLKREGTKTHKERVEELNRYLSNLSEHHDMYVFLPGGCIATRVEFQGVIGS